MIPNIWTYKDLPRFVLVPIFMMCCLAPFVSLLEEVNSESWSYFVFAQRWPSAACFDLPRGEKCDLSPEIKDWIIHGLWPTSEKGYPSFCNSSWPFSIDDVKTIEKDLEVKWPNIISGKTAESFWQHEWSKHGTCAASLDSLNSQLKYFNGTLQLHDTFNLYEILKKESILPSDESYLLNDIENALENQFNKKTMIFCEKQKEFKYPLLDTAYLCMDKNFELIDCDIPDEPPCASTNVIYLPLKEDLKVIHTDL